MLPLLLGCFRGTEKDSKRRLYAFNDGVAQPSESVAGSAVSKLLESELSCISGSWLNRMENLLHAFQRRDLQAELYGFVNSEFVFLSPRDQPPHDANREALLRHLSRIKAPVTQLSPLSPPGRENSAQQHVLAAALPLFHGEALIGALWIQGSMACSNKQPAQEHTTQLCQLTSAPPTAHRRTLPCHTTGRNSSINPNTAAAITVLVPPAPAPAALALLRNEEALQRLCFATSMCLAGSGSDSLGWLAKAVALLRAAPSMQVLTAQLCAAVAAHVRSRFVVEVVVRVALVPPPLAGAAASRAATTTALLFRVQNVANDVGEAAAGGAGGHPGCEGGVPDANIGGGHQRPAPLSTQTSQTRMSPTTMLPVCGATSGGMHPSFKALPGDELTTSGGFSLDRAMAAAVGAATPRSAGQNSLYASSDHGGGSRNFAAAAALATAGTLIVPLSAAEAAAITAAAASSIGAAAAPAAALHAEAFPLHNTLLLAVLDEQRKQQQQREQQQQQENLDCVSSDVGGASKEPVVTAAASATQIGGTAAPPPAPQPLPMPVIENTFQFVQNVHNPWRDVWLLMSRQQHQPPGAGTPSAVLSYDTTLASCGINPTATAVATPSGSSFRSCAPQSLVLLTMGLGEEGAVLGLYVCFPTRLPGPLLEAVRTSCQELVDRGLSSTVRHKLAGSLAAEYDMLKAAAPGSYAVVRGIMSTHEDPLTLSGGGGGGGAGPSSASGHRHTGFLDSILRRRTAPAMAAPPSGPQQQPEMAAALRAFALLAPGADGGSGGSGGGIVTRWPSLLAGTSGMEVLNGGGGGVDMSDRSASAASTASAWRRSMVRRRATAAVGGSLSAKPGQPGSRNSLPTSGPAATAATAVHDLVDLLLASYTTDTAAEMYGSGGGGGAGLLLPPLPPSAVAAEGPYASIITIASVDTATHQRMDVLMNSIHATLQEEFAASCANFAFSGDLNQLELLEVVGRGGGGVVLRGRLSGSLPVAVKLMAAPGDAAFDLGWSTKKARRGLLRNAMELAVQSSLSHPNIVQFYATYRDAVLRARRPPIRGGSEIFDINPRTLYLADASSSSSPAAAAAARKDRAAHGGPDHNEEAAAREQVRVTCILAEYCDGGSLADALVARKFPRFARSRPVAALGMTTPFMYDLKGVYMTLLDVALALRHLHSLNLVHRDVKPANLLLKSNPRDHRGFTVKLADFGFVLQLNETADDGGRYAIQEEPCGTVTHMAPECMTRGSRVSAAADVYSFGILMWELLAAGARPFPSIHPDRVLRLVHRGTRPLFSPDVPQPYQSLAQLCWQSDPARRPVAAQLVQSVTAHLSALGRA